MCVFVFFTIWVSGISYIHTVFLLEYNYLCVNRNRRLGNEGKGQRDRAIEHVNDVMWKVLGGSEFSRCFILHIVVSV